MAGHYKIFLGMAAGVGKTYRMLQEAQAAAEAGRDVTSACSRRTAAGRRRRSPRAGD